MYNFHFWGYRTQTATGAQYLRPPAPLNFAPNLCLVMTPLVCWFGQLLLGLGYTCHLARHYLTS